MRCSKAQRWISRRSDGVLDERLKTPLADHLAQCEFCRAYAEGLAGLEIYRLEAPEPTADFTARVVAHLDVGPVRRWSVLRNPEFFRPIAAGLGIAAALGGFAVGSILKSTNGIDPKRRNGLVELTAGDAIDSSSDDAIESVLIAMVPGSEE